ncbi:MAG: oxidoreductase [Verrucomicrobiales bacterium]|nr:oxidoreductase [Verrucomicrobiales bacterium]|tara:strand:+ start:22585 stop:24477 length:1893 start_codon:yes stop_codon:yes gene_type:complete
MSDHLLSGLKIPMGLGLLRLSTQDRPEEAEAIRVIHHALGKGIRLLDTADTYCLDNGDLHYGEVLARKAIESWDGPKEEIKVITKAGLSRPKGRWMPSGSPESLRKAVEGSLAALGVDQLFMLLLHVKDPKTPFEDSLTALAEMQREGKVAHLGLCNVSIPEVRQAQRHFEVSAIQCELSVMNRKAGTSGMVDLAAQLGIPFLAHRPMGGYAKADKISKNRAMKPLAAKYDVPPNETALATLYDLDHPVIPLIGATRIESIDSSLSALELKLDDDDRTAREKITFKATEEAHDNLEPPSMPDGLRELKSDEEPGTDPEVVVIMGIQGAGKSSLVDAYENAGFHRLNRDLLGGKLEDLIPMIGEQLAGGNPRVILDNTYPTRLSRYPVIRMAQKHKVPVRCIHMATPVGDAVINIVNRVLDRHGKLLGPDEMKELAKTDPNLPPPAALSTYASSFEPPDLDEGFSVVREVGFERRPGPAHQNKGLLLDVDGTLRITKSGEIYPRHPDDVELLPNRREVLQRWIDDGYELFFISNQSGVASKQLSYKDAEACFDRTAELLGLPIKEMAFCPHKAFPVGCFCRKPFPGMGIDLMRKHELSLEHLVMVGDMDSDQKFAESFGANYQDAKEFFGD